MAARNLAQEPSCFERTGPHNYWLPEIYETEHPLPGNQFPPRVPVLPVSRPQFVASKHGNQTLDPSRTTRVLRRHVEESAAASGFFFYNTFPHDCIWKSDGTGKEL
jgi:hypothetical protein